VTTAKNTSNPKPLRVLAIGAHPDDLEIGCGGTLIAHSDRGDTVSLLILTDGNGRPKAAGLRVAEAEAGAEILGAEAVFWGGLEDGEITDGKETVELIDSVIEQVKPDVVYTLWGTDTHQDHRATHLATLAAARRVSRILLYEGPTTVDFRPTLYVDIGDVLDRKIEALRAHASQVEANQLVDVEALEAEARYRGFEARLAHGKAEAFGVARFVWDLAEVADARPTGARRQKIAQ
jgi:LmbE family N-acetylglucosaminyl deacetylase